MTVNGANTAAEGDVAYDEQPSMLPEELVESYYRWYLSAPGQPGARKALRKRRLLSPDFIRKLQAQLQTKETQFDLLFCSQQLPESVSVQEVLIEGDRAEILLRTDQDQLLRILLQSHKSDWRIVDVICQQEES